MSVSFSQAVAAVLVLTAAAACSSDSSGRTPDAPASRSATATAANAGDGQRVMVHALDTFRFDPSAIEAHTGDLAVTLVAEGGDYPHTFAVRRLGQTSRTVGGGVGTPTETTFTLHLTKPGTYAFRCTYHSTAGMRGTITVSRGRSGRGS